ncbi:RNA-splicing ligase RtcB [Carboxydothermus islandicus]|uniref:tRNA-splicing ligase RtcB n=1 Tax=Carboxydothermus islandicus TaxID=661089 RepID=A0A1L8D335_9THEO|nr:RtcB family protein [Carboxydothermus islandicus]GAV25590.1 RNA-splicing ligase RtcB [Carboxydothermus islandicus]
MLKKLNDYLYRLPRTGKMQVEGLIITSEKLLPALYRDESLKQLQNAASLPGVYRAVYGMPDLHEGFGLPIGGVMATVLPEGLISAGAVGMDINCGVRLLTTPFLAEEISRERLAELIKAIEKYVPAGVGKKNWEKEVRSLLPKVLLKGARALLEEGYGFAEDLNKIEEGGVLAGAEIKALSETALSRGAEGLGTLGGGNHFIEVQVVAEVRRWEVAQSFGLYPGMLCLMVHTGSRGLGHQVCTDYTEILYKAGPKYNVSVPVKGLAAVPFSSPEGQRYYQAMLASANFAYANRQLITHYLRQVFKSYLGDGKLDLVYDLAHNIAKEEFHDGIKVLVHRKGATRALPAGHRENLPLFREIGQPVLIPGSMGTKSYVLRATSNISLTFNSLNHGAGRSMSRKASLKNLTVSEVKKALGDVILNEKVEYVRDEAPQAYKDIDLVIEAVVGAGLAEVVAVLKPLAVIKGKD